MYTVQGDVSRVVTIFAEGLMPCGQPANATTPPPPARAESCYVYELCRIHNCRCSIHMRIRRYILMYVLVSIYFFNISIRTCTIHMHADADAEAWTSGGAGACC